MGHGGDERASAGGPDAWSEWCTIFEAAQAWAEECDGWADETAAKIRAAIEARSEEIRERFSRR